jgi:hypothetical protein
MRSGEPSGPRRQAAVAPGTARPNDTRRDPVIAFGAMSRVRRVVLGLLLSALVAGCGIDTTSSPTPTPADFPDLASTLARRGVEIDDVVSGDAGCDDPVLIPTAIGFDASGLGLTTPVRLYLYIFRNRDAFERLRETVDVCAQRYVTDPETFESIDQSPYVLTGQGPWTPEFEAALRQGLEVAAGNGG